MVFRYLYLRESAHSYRGVILYNSSATCFKAIWRNWVRNQNHFENQTNIRDDQYTLGVTLRDKSIAGHRQESELTLPILTDDR